MAEQSQVPKTDICPVCNRDVKIEFSNFAHGYVYADHSHNGSARFRDRCDNRLAPYPAPPAGLTPGGTDRT